MKKGFNKQKHATQTYYVNGMHCASCETLIENYLREQKGVDAVKASLVDGKVEFFYTGRNKVSVNRLNREFSKYGYTFYTNKGEIVSNSAGEPLLKNGIKIGGIVILVLLAFFAVERSGLSTLVSIDITSSLVMVFLFGLVAATSSCTALVGGLLLSMRTQWNNLYPQSSSLMERASPYIAFNVSRVFAFILFGGLLGLVGAGLQMSIGMTATLIIVVSFVMLVLGLQMLGIKVPGKLSVSIPKTVTNYTSNAPNFKGKSMPYVLGAATFFVPCGFTLTAQSIALLSGSFVAGSAIMGAFALGTLPVLALIGYSSVRFSGISVYSGYFNKIAGLVVIFFAIFNINSQLNVLGIPSLTDINVSRVSLSAGDENVLGDRANAPEVIDGKQVLKMEANAWGYTPNKLRVKAGMPVRWEITDVGTSGCTNAIISRELFSGRINLQPGLNVAEFTPPEPGTYKFSCWMGMVVGTIEVL